jgi:hypothetical protein
LYNNKKFEDSIIGFKKVMNKTQKSEKKPGIIGSLIGSKSIYEQAEEYLKKSEEALNIQKKKEAEIKKMESLKAEQEKLINQKKEMELKKAEEDRKAKEEASKKEKEANELFKKSVLLYNEKKFEESAKGFQAVIEKSGKAKSGFLGSLLGSNDLQYKSKGYLAKIEKELKQLEKPIEKKVEKQPEKQVVPKKEEKPKEVDISDLDLKF